ncbi:MAG TPA: alpha/beta hydrolase family protein [Capsulimonadaceae bacterium]|jgi:S-formylglutathione hydrolase FrmB
MAVCEIQLNQVASLGKMASFYAIIPEGKTGPFPVYYLLHGMSDNHTAWTRRTSLERYASGLPIIIIMPDGERSFYTDSAKFPTDQFETYITRDLIGFVDSTWNTIATPKGRAIGGLSMGGYGAIKLALKFPELFGAGVSHSGALEAASHAANPDWSNANEWVSIFGENPTGGPNDIFALMEKLTAATAPALRIDCGSEDFLIESNRRATKRLTELGLPHEYAEYPGGHSWEYWDTHVQEALQFAAKHFGIV